MLPPCLHKTDRVDISAVFDKMTATEKFVLLHVLLRNVLIM